MPRPAPRGVTARLGCAGSPPRVLLGQTNDELLHLIVERRSPCSPARVGPGASDQPPMPAQQRLWRDEKARAAGASRRSAGDWPVDCTRTCFWDGLLV